MKKIYTKMNKDEFYSDFAPILEELDIYYLPSFLAADAFLQKGEYEIFSVSEGNKIWIYPYLLLSFPDNDWYDLISPYGYAGPYCNDITFFEIAESVFIDEIRSRKVVSELVRYHYNFNDSVKSRFQIECTNLENRTVVLVDTSLKEDELWTNSFSGTNRNLVRKLEKENFSWRIKNFEESDIQLFQTMYDATMQNASATDFYYFDTAFYQKLIQELGNKIKIAFVEKENVIFSVSLFFVHGKIATYYLSARNLDYPKVTGSNFLLSKMAFWAHENGYKTLNLGGGLSNDPEDRLYKFKKNFSSETATFYIGKRIHDQEKYALIRKKYISEYGEEAYSKVNFMIQYYRQ